MSFDPVPFEFVPAVRHWAAILFVAAAAVGFVTFLASLAAGGWSGPRQWAGHVVAGFGDLLSTSPRRVWALAVLTLREAVRRKALYVFVVFALLFMFGGWFLTDANPDPTQQVTVYVSFVLRAVSWLVMPVALLLSCWGLPEDIRLRSLHTVVTKPVRRHEVVAGRILGFTLVTTFVLVTMSVVGYFWIGRQVPPKAQPYLVARVPVYGQLSFVGREGNYVDQGINVGDVWEFRSYIEGATRSRAIWIMQGVGPHMLRDDGTLRIESTFESFRSFKGDMSRGLYAQIAVVNDERERFARGVAVAGLTDFEALGRAVYDGRFAEARGEAQTLADRIRRTEGAGALQATPDQFRRLRDAFATLPPLFAGWAREISDLAARSSAAAGEVAARADDKAALAAARAAFADEIGKLGEALTRHGEALAVEVADVRVTLPPFPVREFRDNLLDLSRTLSYVRPDSAVGVPVDLFDDLAPDGRLRIEVACLDAGQYLGMARPDLFIRLDDRPFASTYFKAVAGIWMSSFLVVVLGVTGSCFLKGPVATLFAFTVWLVGLGFRSFMDGLVKGWLGEGGEKLIGGGPFESIYRILMHYNQTQPLKDPTVEFVVKNLDAAALNLLWLFRSVIPDFTRFDLAEWAAKGYDVDFRAGLLPCIVQTVAFLVPCLVVGYYALRLRELEAK
jgi:hypothetical protein